MEAIIENMNKTEISEEINKVKSRLFANMSHEMRTPLNVVVGLTDFMLEDENPSLNLKENLTKINVAGNALLRFIDDLLNNSQAETGKFETEDKQTVRKKLERPDLSYAKVLVVDDMQTNLDVAANLLRLYKMQVDCVKSGEEAVDLINREGTHENPAYNAIFMDYMMPEMDGIETARAIRNLGTEYARMIPIIAVTANAIKGSENMFYINGFQDFLSKPIGIRQLDSVIRKWIHQLSQEK